MEAAVVAAEQMEQQRQELRKSLELELEQARYEARLAARRYEAVDPEQRLVAAELEARWNSALQKTRELEDKLQDFDRGRVVAIPNCESRRGRRANTASVQVWKPLKWFDTWLGGSPTN